MATLYENYITGDTARYFIQDVSRPKAQTFTSSINHIISSVKLKVFRVGSPGTVTVGIYATDGDDKPTGSALCSGTTNGNSFLTTPGSFIEITFSIGALIEASRIYAIVLSCAGASPTNSIAWRVDNTQGYAAGGGYTSADTGATWSILTNSDFMFEEWGDPQGSGGGGSIFPSDDVARVSSIRHIFRPGFFRMQAGLGDLGFDIDIAETAVKTELDTAKGPPVSPVTGRPLPTRWPPAPGEFPDPIACPRCGMIVPYLELVEHMRTAHPLRATHPPVTPEEEAQIIKDIGIRLWNKLKEQQ